MNYSYTVNLARIILASLSHCLKFGQHKWRNTLGIPVIVLIMSSSDIPVAARGSH